MTQQHARYLRVRRAMLVMAGILVFPALRAQHEFHWVGGSGAWEDARHWSQEAGGIGGAGVPGAHDVAVVRPPQPVTIGLRGSRRCASLILDGSPASAMLNAAPDVRLEIAGSLHVRGAVQVAVGGGLHFTGDAPDAVIDTRGTVLASDLVVDGAGTWSVHSDLTLDDAHALVVREGSVRTNTNIVRVGALRFTGRGPKLFDAGTSVVFCASAYEPSRSPVQLVTAEAALYVAGIPHRWDVLDPAHGGPERGISTCGTGPGQTPFTINATAPSDYNGFDVSCNGVCDGSTTVTVTGGSGSFTYQWQTGPSTQTWNNTCVGNKLVIVTDQVQNIGCAATVQVLGPPPLGVIFFPALTPPTCAGVCNGTGNALAVGGTGSGYTYSWNNGAGTNASFNQLCAGTNTLRIRDNNNCQFDTTFIINLQPVTPNLTFTNVTCNGACNGTATVAPTGGTGAYTYSWSPAPGGGQGTASATGLCAGSWSVTVTDANGCVGTVAFTITQPQPILASVVKTDVVCAGACTGSATVTPSGGTGPYTFAWSPAPGGGQGTNNATGLCAGTYTVTVTDQPSGCSIQVPVTIAQPPALAVTATVAAPICAGDCNGSVSLVVTGGTGTYTYSWAPQPPSGQGTAGITGLCAGSWSVTVVDAAGCDTTITFDLPAPAPVLPNEVITPITCAGACDGVITCAPTGGSGTYTYVWSPLPPAGQGTPTATGLCAGTWSVTITDAAGCDTAITVVLDEPDPLAAVPAQTNISCGTACDGTAGVVVSGGTVPYAFLWTPAPGSGQGSANAAGLCAGPVSVTITDDAGCSLVVPFTILPAPPLTVVLDLSDAACADLCDGSAAAQVGGGYPPFSYQWDPLPGSGQGTASATGLCAGDYSLTVIDSTGCDTTVTFTIGAPLPLVPNAAVQNVSCFGACDGSIVLAPSGGSGVYTYTWSPVPPNAQGTPNATGLCAGDWQVTVSDGTCDTVLVFTITQPTEIQVAPTIGGASCAGLCDGTVAVTVSGGVPAYAYQWAPPPLSGQGTSQADGLCAGLQTLLVTDDTGCDTLLSFVIDAPPPLVPQLTTTPADCGGACNGTATVAFTGGTGAVSILWDPAPGSGQGTSTASDLCPGVYEVTLTDSLGCDTTLQFIITTPSGIQAVPTVFDASCFDACDGAIDLDVSGGVPAYTYSWTPVPPIGAGASISGLCSGPWTVQISDLAGCDTVLVLEVNAPAEILPNGVFTNETCNGPCDGTATVNPTGGAGGFTYSWSPAPPVGQGTNAVSGLCAGDWTVTITDASGCDTVWTFTVLPAQPIQPGLSTYDTPCAYTCSGAAAVAPSGGIPGYTYQWSPQPPEGQATDSISGLCLGEWNVLITDAVGCDTLVTFLIDKPNPLQLSLGFSAADCNDPCSGEAAIAPAGGIPGYTVVWQPEPPVGQGSFAISGLCAGTTYSVTLTDTLGCDTTETFTILPFQPIATGINPTAASCGGTCDGSAILDLFGGEAPYTFDWSPDPGAGEGSQSPSQLCAGVYDVLIVDNNGCDTTASVTITAPPAIAVNPAVTPVVCAGSCTAAIELGASGGAGPLTFTWSPAPPVGQGTGSVAQLCAGTWTVVVTDGIGCDTTVTFQIADPPPLVVAPVLTQSQCQQCIGSADLQTAGGSGGYTYAWGAPLNITTTDAFLPGLCSGVYAVSVADASGCSVDMVIPITDAQGESLLADDDLVTCPSDCDGLVTVAYTCTTPACQTTWYDAAGTVLASGTDTLQGLCVGQYLITLVNGDGCLSVDTANVSAPDPLLVSFSTQSPACASACDGAAALGITGGATPYTINWSPAPLQGQGTAQASGLCAGVYTAAVTDVNGCTVQVDVLILDPAPIGANAQVSNVTCAGTCDGGIAIQPTGGAGSFVVVWSPVPPNGAGALESGPLCAGTYSLLLVDGNGCDTTLTIPVTEPPALSAVVSATGSNCQVCDGTAQVVISGGTPNVDVQWTDVAGVSIGNGEQLAGLCAGIYTAAITDANGCAAQVTAVVSDAAGEALAITDGITSCSNACDADVSVSFACTSGPCEIFWYDAQGVALAVNQFTLTGLCTGSYYVAVQNGAGCTVIDTAQVLPAQVINVATSTSAVTCSGACDGAAAVLPTGGVAPYTYDWSPDPPVGDSTAQVSGLCPGVWNVSIADATGCDTTIAVLITGPSPIELVAQTVNVACNGACDGTVSIFASGGNGGYSYAWDPQPANGQGTAVISGLCPDAWSVAVTDSLGCTAVLQANITEPAPLVLGSTATQSDCGICNGTAAVQASGGTSAYTYAWTGNAGAFGTDSLQADLCAGLYSVLVTDANGCQATATVPVSDVDGELLAITNDVVTCPGLCDGTVVVSLNCSEPSCTIAWYDIGGNQLAQGVAELSDLCAGSYYVQVTNALGCISIDTALVTAPAPIQVNLGTTPVSCAASCDGSAVASPTGGVAPFTYDWSPDPIIGDSTSLVTGLCAGVYTVLITDSIGCSITQDLVIQAPLPIAVQAAVDSVSCNAVCDASIAVTATGGTGAYTYAWSPVPPNGQGDSLATDLCAGAWSVTITDANGCDTTLQFNIADPPLLDVVLTTVDNQCFSDCIGQAVATLSGGTGAYASTWLDAFGTVIAQGDTTLNDLCAGDYAFTASDANGCIVERTFNITQGLPIIAGLAFLGETCDGPCDGTAAANPVGGAGGFQVSWLDANGNVFLAGQFQVQGLCAGNWTLVVTDSLGCDTLVPFTILPYTPINPNASVSGVLCAGQCNGAITLAPTGGIGGYGYDWEPFPPGGDGNPSATGLCAGTWSVTITDAVGCTDTSNYVLSDPELLSIVVDGVTAAACNTSSDGAILVTVGGGTGQLTTSWTGPNGFVSSAEDLTDLFPGDYLLTLTDANGCSIEQGVTVPALNSVVADAGPAINQCAGVPITLNASGSQGATSFTWTDAQGNVLGTGVTLALGVLSPDAYTVTLTATAGPCSDQDVVQINVLALPIADAGPDRDILLGATATLGGVPGPPESTYLWSPDSLVSTPTVLNPTTSPDVTTWFVLQVTTEQGCSDIDSVLVTVVPEIVIPTGFSPNSDGHNDAWQIDHIDLFPDSRVEVYNRWGELLFASDGYPTPWDGTYNGELVPVGTYYYAIELNDPRFPEPYTGPLTVIR